MKPLTERYGSWALVAGAAEGLGEALSLQLAEAGCNVILVDRNEHASQLLADRLIKVYKIQTQILIVDLSAPGAADRCLAAAADVNCRLILYVAAWSRVTRFLDLTPEDLDTGLTTNNHTLIRMVHGFAKRLADTGQGGGILLISSLAGLIGPKYVATYAATKSFIIRLTESLHGELAAEGIDIMACCAGTISTPAFWKSKPALGRFSPPVMEPAAVARYSLKMLGRKVICIPGWKNRLQYWLLSKLIPGRLAEKLVNSAMEKMYG